MPSRRQGPAARRCPATASSASKAGVSARLRHGQVGRGGQVGRRARAGRASGGEKIAGPNVRSYDVRRTNHGHQERQGHAPRAQRLLQVVLEARIDRRPGDRRRTDRSAVDHAGPARRQGEGGGHQVQREHRPDRTTSRSALAAPLGGGAGKRKPAMKSDRTPPAANPTTSSRRPPQKRSSGGGDERQVRRRRRTGVQTGPRRQPDPGHARQKIHRGVHGKSSCNRIARHSRCCHNQTQTQPATRMTSPRRGTKMFCGSVPISMGYLADRGRWAGIPVRGDCVGLVGICNRFA